MGRQQCYNSNSKEQLKGCLDGAIWEQTNLNKNLGKGEEQ